MGSKEGSLAISKLFKPAIIIILISCALVKSKVFTKCELGITLIANGIDPSDVGEWICLASSASNLNSKKETGDASKGYGIFQISNYWYCWDELKQQHNECKLNCTDLMDDDLSDDIKCALLIKKRQNFTGGWASYKYQCENKSLDYYTDGCDFFHGRIPIIPNSETNINLYLNSTNEQIVCESEGTLPIQLRWLKYDKEVRPNQYPVEMVEDPSHNSTSLAINFDRVTADTAGIYTCEASSIYGQNRINFFVRVFDNNTGLGGEETSVSVAPSVKVQDASTPSALIAISVILTILVTTLVFYVYYRRHSVRKGSGGLTKLQINAFYEGLPEIKKEGKEIDESNESILAKIYSKPYRKYEFEIPESDLEIDADVVLGSGQFGIVYKGNYKRSVPVAVKTIQVQETPENTAKQLQALMDEVKIMSFIGQHPNIVSLLGAQTKDLKNDKLYVVLEYCPVGSLKSFLKKQRSKEIPECPIESISKDDVNVEPDYKPLPENEEIYIKDFVSYAYQIAYAMDYLTQKRIIHADLAARNVLLLDKYIVKVTDFGLSKRMSDYEQYIKNNQEFVPWRWWSIESLRDFTFTSKSDVWSYGVTLWEIFSLAEVPHPEQSWNPEFSKKLKDGLRLLKPDLASDHMYYIMCQCWKEKPEERPTFHQICDMMRITLRKMSKFEGEYGESQYSVPPLIGNGENTEL